MIPSATSMPPAERRSGIQREEVSSRQREIHQGTKPATNPGAMTRKNAEPMIANTFLLMSSCKPISWSCTMGIAPRQLKS